MLPAAQAAHRPARSIHHSNTRADEHSGETGSQHVLAMSQGNGSQHAPAATSHSYHQRTPWQTVDSTASPRELPRMSYDSHSYDPNSYSTAGRHGQMSYQMSPQYSDAGSAYQVYSEKQPSSQDIVQTQSSPYSAAGFERPDIARSDIQSQQAHLQRRMQQITHAKERLSLEQKQLEEAYQIETHHSLYDSQSSGEQYHVTQQHPQHRIQYSDSPAPAQYPHQRVFCETTASRHSYPQERHVHQPAYQQQQHASQACSPLPHYAQSSYQQSFEAPVYQEHHAAPNSYHQSDHSMDSASGHFAPLSSQHSQVLTQQRQPFRTESSAMPEHAHQLPPYDHASNQAPYDCPSGVETSYSPSHHLQPANGHYSADTGYAVLQGYSQDACASAWYGADEVPQPSHGNPHHSTSQHLQPALRQASNGHSDYDQLSHQYPGVQYAHSSQLGAPSHRHSTDDYTKHRDATSVQQNGRQPVPYSEQQQPETCGTDYANNAYRPQMAQQQPQAFQHTSQRKFSNQNDSQHHHTNITEAPHRPQEFKQRQHVKTSAHLMSPEHAVAVNGHQSGMASGGVRGYQAPNRSQGFRQPQYAHASAQPVFPEHANAVNGYQSGMDSDGFRVDVHGEDAYAPLPGGRRKLREVTCCRQQLCALLCGQCLGSRSIDGLYNYVVHSGAWMLSWQQLYIQLIKHACWQHAGICHIVVSIIITF